MEIYHQVSDSIYHIAYSFDGKNILIILSNFLLIGALTNVPTKIGSVE